MKTLDEAIEMVCQEVQEFDEQKINTYFEELNSRYGDVIAECLDSEKFVTLISVCLVASLDNPVTALKAAAINMLIVGLEMNKQEDWNEHNKGTRVDRIERGLEETP